MKSDEKSRSIGTPVSEIEIETALGWAILFACMLLDTGLVDHPRHAVMGERILRRVCEESRKYLAHKGANFRKEQVHNSDRVMCQYGVG